jgi:hypothetical protein
MSIDDFLNAQHMVASLQEESGDATDRIFDLLAELDAVDILRLHTPPSRRWQLDRLETALQLVDRLHGDIDDAIAYREYVAAELEKGE